MRWQIGINSSKDYAMVRVGLVSRLSAGDRIVLGMIDIGAWCMDEMISVSVGQLGNL